MLESISDFLNRFREFEANLTAQRVQRFYSGFGHLKTKLMELQSQYEEWNREHASGFNVFRLLGVVHDEVNTHSALLADLLNPEGAHGQRHLLLKSFLEMCARKHPDFPLPRTDVSLGRWLVEKEKITPLGNMDLAISNRTLEYLLVIENKIWAPEQPDQLKRYSDWMKSRKHYFTDQALIYLTPRGVPSSTSMGCRYFTLSYREDVREWLEATHPDVEALKVKQIIAQYLETIDSL